MKTVLRTGALALALLLMASLARSQNPHEFGNIAERQRTSTVLGGTGLFNTFSTRTLYKGEFNFALFWNNFDRGPGAIDINQVPFNITVGLTNRWELWVDWVTWQQTTSRQPFLLSGYQYNAVRQFGSPFDILGPPVGGRNGGAAFFPGTGSLVGGILPALGRFGLPSGGAIPINQPSPAGPNGSPVAGLGPAFVADQPNYFNDLPMFGVVDFLGFDSLGRPVLGPRESTNGTGDVYAGTKFNLIDPNRHWFSLALGGYVKFPISRSDDARASGRTSGEFEYGPMLILGQEFFSHRLRFYENVGYIHTNDIHQRGVKVLDLRDKLQLNVGGALAINKYIELVGELAGTVYVGSGTPSLQQSDPLDLNLGARFFLRDGTIAFGGAYRRQLNGVDSNRLFDSLECVEVVVQPPDDCHHHDGDAHAQCGDCGCPPPPPPTKRVECKQKQVRFNRGNQNGFVGFFSVGTRKGCPPPPVPVCVIESSGRTLTRGDRLRLTVKPSTPGYPDTLIAYDYRWEIRDARGNAVSVNGTGPVVEVPTAGLECGSYTAVATVNATARGAEHPDCPDRTAQSNCSVAFEITEAPCPNITCNIVASNTNVTEGDRITLRATGTGDSNFSYNWTTTGGRLSATTGREVTLNTTGVIGPITITVRLAPDRTRCGEPCPGSSCSLTITTREVPPPPTRPRPLIPCGPIFFVFNSARITNEHKACLDEVAIQLQQDPRSTAVIDGHRDSAERVGISLTRANNARDYLVTEKGIDAARITVRNFGDTCPFPNGDRKLNGRVEFWILPEGATIEDVDAVKKCASGSTPRVITGEQPAPSTPTRRTPRRRGRPEPIADGDEEDAEPESAPTSPVYVQAQALPSRPASPPTQPDAALARATVVRAVNAQVVDGGVRITITTDGAAQYQDFTLANPARIVIDITGVRWAGGSAMTKPAAGLVERLRVGEPQAGTVRIVLDMKTAAGYRVSRSGSVITITIGERAIAAMAGSD
ncbi:MAG TPA: AMIN domain-containing protein [Blastocatellia bacterium]|nr:AMIN domain-containing protein [Blastocatellia bacterium]